MCMVKNIAYIDGQNLHLATSKHPTSPWFIELRRFREYLNKKYQVKDAYYWLGYVNNSHDSLYEEIQKAGFILKFREHHSSLASIKKGNVDTDIVFDIMLRLYRKEEFSKIAFVSGDGDYKRMIDFLILEDKLAKLIFPDKKRASSLYRKINNNYYIDLSENDIRRKIQKEKGT
jgi:uncharacterized LabA/DUF88 family protein